MCKYWELHISTDIDHLFSRLILSIIKRASFEPRSEALIIAVFYWFAQYLGQYWLPWDMTSVTKKWLLNSIMEV